MNNEDRISNEQCTMNNVQWRKVKLGEVGYINPPNKDTIPNQFVYIDLECVLSGQLLFENQISKRNAPSRAQRIVNFNDVLYQTVRPYQQNNYIHKKQGNYVASTGYALIRCYEDFEPDFVYYLLHTHKFESVVLGLCTGTSYPAIAPNNLKRIEISIPSLTVQRRIAAILSSADKVIASTQKVIDKLKQIKQGMMDDLLKPKDGWRMVKLGECCDDIFSGRNTKRNDFGKYIVFGSTGIIGYSETYEYDFDSVLVARVGANAGLVNIARGLYDVSDNTLIIKFGKNIFLDYLYYLLIQMNLNQYIFGSGQPLVTAGLLKNLDIFIPDLSEQRRISTILSGIDSKIAAEEKVLEKYKSIKKGLMEKLLNGK